MDKDHAQAVKGGSHSLRLAWHEPPAVKSLGPDGKQRLIIEQVQCAVASKPAKLHALGRVHLRDLELNLPPFTSLIGPLEELSRYSALAGAAFPLARRRGHQDPARPLRVNDDRMNAAGNFL